MKKILFTTLTSSPHLNPFLNALSNDKDVDLHVLFELKKSSNRNWNPGQVDFENTTLNSYSIKMKSCFDFNLYRYLKRFNEYNFLIIGTSPWSINTWITLLWCKINQIKYITFSEVPSNSLGTFKIVKKFIHKFIYSNAVAYSCVTKSGLKYYNEVHGRKPSVIIPYHANLSKFKLNKVKEKSSIKNFIFLGQFCQNKNVIHLLNTFSEIEDADITLTFVGDGDLKEQLHNLSRADPRVNFVAKVVNDKVAELLGNYDCLILPSFNDGYGMVIIEALASGLPVIASDQCMSAIDNVINNYNGWIFDINNKDGLKAAMNSSLSADLIKLSKNSRKSIENISAETSVRKLKYLLNELVL